MFKHISIITNDGKDPEGWVTRRVQAFLESHGCSCTLAEHVRQWGLSQREAGPAYQVAPDTDLCLVLGGDGTMLLAAGSVRGTTIPILGINLGTLGYLAEIEQDAIEEALEQLLAGDYDLEERMMLSGEVLLSATEENGADRPVCSEALNDIVIARTGALQVISLDIYVNGMFLNNYSADGIIVSTPTGSTGYNMSAGGPIVEPSAQMILLTPICPHTLTTRSIVLSPSDEVTIRLGEGRNGRPLQAGASFDGEEGYPIQSGDSIRICRADHTTRIVRLRKESFLKTLHRKLS